MFDFVAGYQKDVLCDTNKGRKRKLSLYRSRNAKKRNIVQSEAMTNSEGTRSELQTDSSSSSFMQQEDNPNMNPVQIAPESDIDYSVEVKHCDSSISEKDYETLNITSEESQSEILLNESSSESHVNEGRTFQQ